MHQVIDAPELGWLTSRALGGRYSPLSHHRPARLCQPGFRWPCGSGCPRAGRWVIDPHAAWGRWAEGAYQPCPPGKLDRVRFSVLLLLGAGPAAREPPRLSGLEKRLKRLLP